MDTTPEPKIDGRRAWLDGRRRQERAGGRHTPMGHVKELPYLLDEFLMASVKWVLTGCGLWRRGIRNALDIRTERLDFHLPELPSAFDGYRILHITDLHLDELPEVADVLRERIRELDADLCVITGDFWDWHAGRDARLAAALDGILAAVRARDGTVAILGNHDAHWMAEILAASGVEVLLNATHHVDRDGGRLAITGLDDVHRFYTRAAADALANCEGDFSIALVHSPEMAEEAAAHGFGLYLCGHCHGGQVCLPGGFAPLKRLHRNRHLYAGRWRIGDMQGYTSHGAGVSGQPVRLNSRGEITALTLYRENAGGE